MMNPTAPSAALAASSIKAGNDATITFRLPQDLKDTLEARAGEQNVKLSKLIKKLLEEALIASADRIVCRNTTITP